MNDEDRGMPPGDVIIRPMTFGDLDDVCRIEKENFSRPWLRHDFEGSIARSDAVFLTALMVQDISGNYTSGKDTVGQTAAHAPQKSNEYAAGIGKSSNSGERCRNQKETGAVAGYIGFYGVPDEGDITNVSVKKEFRNRGIGTLLLSELIRETGRRGFRKIFLEVRRSNKEAIGLYERNGFRQVGVRRKYYDAPVEDALIMMRDEEESKNVFTGF